MRTEPFASLIQTRVGILFFFFKQKSFTLMESKAVLQHFRLTDALGTFRGHPASPQQRLGMGQ